VRGSRKGAYYCYMVECADGTLYTGWTTDPARRVKEHNSGRGALYTRWRRPVALIYLEEAETRSAAQKRENFIKSLSRNKKLALVKDCQISEGNLTQEG
jgi:putative endonuclease